MQGLPNSTVISQCGKQERRVLEPVSFPSREDRSPERRTNSTSELRAAGDDPGRMVTPGIDKDRYDAGSTLLLSRRAAGTGVAPIAVFTYQRRALPTRVDTSVFLVENGRAALSIRENRPLIGVNSFACVVYDCDLCFWRSPIPANDHPARVPGVF